MYITLQTMMFLLVHCPFILFFSCYHPILRSKISPILHFPIYSVNPYLFSSSLSPSFQTSHCPQWYLKHTSNWACTKPNSLSSLRIASLWSLLWLTLTNHPISQVRNLPLVSHLNAIWKLHWIARHSLYFPNTIPVHPLWLGLAH